MEFDKHEEYEYYMRKAYEEALKAFEYEEVPIGCVIVLDNKIIGHGFNKRNSIRNSLCHAEIIAIDMACRNIGDWRLENSTLFVTIEPCPMCAGAIIQSRIKTVVFGARNPKAGCAGSIINILDNNFNHKTEIVEGIMREECSYIMSEFFKRFRN